jgi:hypothetical protein
VVDVENEEVVAAGVPRAPKEYPPATEIRKARLAIGENRKTFGIFFIKEVCIFVKRVILLILVQKIS